MATQTTNYGFTKPAIGDTNWGDGMNTNLDLIDAALAAPTLVDTSTGQKYKLSVTDGAMTLVPTS